MGMGEEKDKEGQQSQIWSPKETKKDEEEIENQLVTSGCLQDIYDTMIEFRGNGRSKSFHASQVKSVLKFVYNMAANP